MSHIDIDPYQILNISHDAILEQVKEAYRQLARTHHPDRDGNPETFKIIKIASKMIIDNLKKGVPIPKQNSSTFVDLKEQAQNYQPVQKQLEPHEFLGKNQPINPNREFDQNTFNQKFLQSRKDTEDYLLAGNGDDYREKRTKQQLLSEQAEIENELGKIQPMFDPKQFDNNAFQQMFQFLNGDPKTKALQVYDEPEALVSGLQPYTEIDETHKVRQTDKLSSLGFSGYEEGFNGQKNPSQIDSDLLTKFAKQPDVTKVNEIDGDYHNTMKKRLNDYQSVQVNYHPAPVDPKQLPENLRGKNSTVDKVSQQNFNDAFSKKLQERNSLLSNLKYGQGNDPTRQTQSSADKSKDKLADRNLPIKHHALPIMDYPRNSNLPNESSTYSVPETQHMQLSPPRNSNYPAAPSMNNQNYVNPLTNQPQLPSANDYFAKIPTATQNPQQIHQNYPQMPINMNMGYNNLPSMPMPMPQLPTFQKPQTVDFDLIQKQLQTLQKTVKEQNKMIKTLSLKKKPTVVLRGAKQNKK